MKKEASKKGYDFQLSLINDDRVYWNKVEKVYQDKNLLKRLVQTVVIRCGCIGFFAK